MAPAKTTVKTTADTTDRLVAELAAALGSEGPSIAIAESCTGGMLCGAMVSNPDASGWLERGLVVYSVDAKCALLGLDREQVEACAGVSSEVALAMAEAVLERSEAGIGLGVTGFAGPQRKDEEVGRVHIAVASRSGDPVERGFHFGDGAREELCRRSVDAALAMLIERVRDYSCEAAER